MRTNSRRDARAGARHDEEMAGIDALDLPLAATPGRLDRAWHVTWPKAAAVALLLLGWQLVVSSGWKPTYVLPGPAAVGARLVEDVADGSLLAATATTLSRALIGYAIAVVLGVVLGAGVAGSRGLRLAVGSLITGVQTMPSIAWFPLAILLFQLSENAILFVIVLGAAPAVANGMISGIDHIPPLLLRAGRVLGARGLDTYRHVVLPAALPGLVAGLKQGWAFAWRSLMAGELLVIIEARPSLGARLQFARDTSDAEALLAAMVVILLVGVLVDALVFARLDRAIRRRRGLDAST